MKKKNKKNFEVTEVDEIIELFQKNNWDMDQKNKKSLFNRFIKRYKEIDDLEKRIVFLRLSSEYRKVNLNDYMVKLIDILHRIFQDEKKENVFVMPLIQKNEISKIKSGSFMTYLFKSVDLFYYDRLIKKKFQIIENYEILKEKKIEGKYLLLVDDYIGSGNQAYRSLKDVLDFLKNENMDYEKFKGIYIVSLFINEKGKLYLEKKIGDIGSDSIILYFAECTKTNVCKYDLIIESMKYKDGDDTRLGYKNTKDLISLIRTPNNTIPLFKCKSNNAPFPR